MPPRRALLVRLLLLAMLAMLAMLATLAACAGERDAGEPDEHRTPDALRDELVQHGLQVPTGSRIEARAALGAPDSASARPEPNRHLPALTDTIVELFYPALRLEYRVVDSGRTDFLSVADVRDDRYLTYPELGVGTPAAEVMHRLGEPQERTGSVLRYFCASCMGAESPVEFHVADGRVWRVRFTFYVD